MTRFPRSDLTLFVALAAIMLATRTHSLSQAIHLPDTSLATFFVAGYYIRSRLAFPALFALALAIDASVIALTGADDFCFTPAYALLVPAYGAMWVAGSWARRTLAPQGSSLPAILALAGSAAVVAELLASGGFYFLGGRFAEPTLVGFLPRLWHYLPYTLGAALGWIGVAALGHAAAIWLRRDLRIGAGR